MIIEEDNALAALKEGAEDKSEDATHSKRVTPAEYENISEEVVDEAIVDDVQQK